MVQEAKEKNPGMSVGIKFQKEGDQITILGWGTSVSLWL